MEELLKSVYSSQNQLLSAIVKLHVPGGFDCDMTYGRGGFWDLVKRPQHCFDIAPTAPHVVQADSRQLPLPSGSVFSVIFDPPFLCYVRGGRSLSSRGPALRTPDSIMSQRFGGYWAYEELTEHYKATLREAARVLKPKGVFTFKCQDIIHNHRLYCTHANIIQWAAEFSFRLMDLFVLLNHRKILPVRAAKHGQQTQRHARIQHSYFLVFKKKVDNNPA